MPRVWGKAVTHTSPCPPPSSPSSSPNQVDRGSQSAPTPTPAACCHHHAGNPAAGPEQARVPFGLSVPVSSLQKTKESQDRREGRTEEDGQTQRKDRRREGGGGKRPNRGKGGGDRRLVHQIPTMQPQLPRPEASQLANGCSSDAEAPTVRSGDSQAPAGTGEVAGLVRQLRLMAASVAAAAAPPDVMHPPSSAPLGVETLLLSRLATTRL